jgi:hypothetical protein
MQTIEEVNELNEGKKNAAVAGVFVGFTGIFFTAWSLAGVIAFIMSIVCFGYSGTPTEHAIGLIIALLFGPFYWLFYYFAPNYCKTVSNVASAFMGGKRN